MPCAQGPISHTLPTPCTGSTTIRRRCLHISHAREVLCHAHDPYLPVVQPPIDRVQTCLVEHVDHEIRNLLCVGTDDSLISRSWVLCHSVTNHAPLPAKYIYGPHARASSTRDISPVHRIPEARRTLPCWDRGLKRSRCCASI